MTIRRLKTYTGNTGYVYQYYFVGKRPAITRPADSPTTEYVFDVTSDRKNTYSISVFFSRAVSDTWAAAHGRSLTDAEQYAAVKMRLFQAFDELDDLSNQGRRLVIDSSALETALSTLGVD
jgi:hypothetical protein